MDVVEYVLWSRMWAIQQYARPSIHQELSGMLPSIHKSCNTYTLNINTRFILSVIIFISMFYWIPLEHSDQITFPFLLICSIHNMSWISVQNFTLRWPSLHWRGCQSQRIYFDLLNSLLWSVLLTGLHKLWYVLISWADQGSRAHEKCLK